MTVIIFGTSADLTDENGDQISWFLIPEPGLSTMPYSTNFEFGGVTWYVEYEVIRGKTDDFLMLHVFKVINEVPTPILDTKISNGMQLKIDDTIRLYGFDIKPYLQDNYLREKAGKYQIMVSEVT